MRDFSILGLTLLAASAVTAVVIPAKSDNKSDRLAFGSLTHNSSIFNGGQLSSITCAPDTGSPSPIFLCNASTGIEQGDSETTGIILSGNNDSTSLSSFWRDGGYGENNTTSSWGS